MADNIDRRVRATISRIVGVDYVTAEQHLRDDVGAKGLDRIDIALTLEGEYDIEISEASACSWQTVTDVIRSVERRLEQRRAAA